MTIKTISFREQINEAFVFPELQSAAETRQLSIDPADLIMATFKHNYDAKQKVLALAHDEQVVERSRHPRVTEAYLKAIVTIKQVMNNSTLERLVVGERFAVTSLNGGRAITESDSHLVEASKGIVCLEWPKSFRTGHGVNNFNLYRGLLLLQQVRVQPYDDIGKQLVTLQTL